MNNCRLCRSDCLIDLINFGSHPIAHHFLSNPQEKEDKYPVELIFCNNCGLVQLTNSVPQEAFYTNYICLSSWKYQPHIPQLIRIVQDNSQINKNSLILEAGSNDGIFLEALRNQGYTNLVGIEPACDAYASSSSKGLDTINTYFNTESATNFVKRHGECNLFISRQMLEHIGDLEDFAKSMRIVAGDDGITLFEVPNFSCNLRTFDYTLWEEHLNYFTYDTLKYFLESQGFEVLFSKTLLFSGEALIVIAKYTGKKKKVELDYMDALRDKVFRYRDNWPKFRSEFIEYLSQNREKGKKIAVYGAGARLCSLINFTGLKPYIEFIVDDQQEKQNKFLPGSKLPILPSNVLNDESIDLCLLAVNTESEQKVLDKHSDFIDRGGEFVSVLAPSDKLPIFWKNIS